MLLWLLPCVDVTFGTAIAITLQQNFVATPSSLLGIWLYEPSALEPMVPASTAGKQMHLEL